jgi:hypothetical protein
LLSLNNTPSITVGEGSLLSVTVNGNPLNIYIAAALGVMKYNNIPFQVISIQSPLGAALRGHKTGDSITFNQKKYTITELA